MPYSLVPARVQAVSAPHLRTLGAPAKPTRHPTACLCRGKRRYAGRRRLLPRHTILLDALCNEKMGHSKGELAHATH